MIKKQIKTCFCVGCGAFGGDNDYLLSLFVEWVKLFTDKVTRGGKMKKWMLAICLMFINEICHATDCLILQAGITK